MGTLRGLHKKTTVDELPKPRLPREPRLEGALVTTENELKLDFWWRLIDILQDAGPFPLTLCYSCGFRHMSHSGNMELRVPPSACRDWINEFVNGGYGLEKGGIYWLPQQTPPAEEITTLYSLIPDGKAKPATAARLARQTGLTIEYVEMALELMKDKYRWNVFATNHRPARYFLNP